MTARFAPKKSGAMKACDKAFRAGRKREQRDEHKKEDVEPEENSVVASDGVVHDVMTDPEESQAYKGD